MDSIEMGRLVRVELRESWTHEATSFTPWLAKEENLDLLGETIGIDLELEGQEKNVGPFRADILCKDTVSGNWVLIENQLERTDHGHLGQLITYAAGLNAVTMVWIAAHVTDEHRAALDWLNEVTNSQINFFGLEIELWKIGNSLPAPKFNIVSKPNDWAKIVSGGGPTKPGGLTETQQTQLEYWRQLAELLQENNSIVRPQKPLPQSWADFAIGRSNFGLEAWANPKENRIGISLFLGGPDTKAHFHLLRQEMSTIESEIGSELEWNERPGKYYSFITKWHPEANSLDRSTWQQQMEWLRSTLELFYRVFATRVRNLRADQYQPVVAVQ